MYHFLLRFCYILPFGNSHKSKPTEKRVSLKKCQYISHDTIFFSILDLHTLSSYHLLWIFFFFKDCKYKVQEARHQCNSETFALFLFLTTKPWYFLHFKLETTDILHKKPKSQSFINNPHRQSIAENWPISLSVQIFVPFDFKILKFCP